MSDKVDSDKPKASLKWVFAVVGVTSLAAFWMYIDRVCFGILADPIQKDLNLTAENKGDILGAFFFTYALFQIPMGTLADRYGARLVLALSIVAWSTVTALTGFASTFAALFAVRLLLGITEAGAYPAAAGLVKYWAPPWLRGVCSSAVALGGRIGGASAPFLTASLAAMLVGFGPTEWNSGASGVNWRAVFVVYGVCGIAVAVLFWMIVRDRDSKTTIRVSSPPFFRQLGTLAMNRNMWLFGAVQFGVNLAWAFLITLMPTYLNEKHDIPLSERSQMQSVALITGCIGMLIGGGLTDYLRAVLGPRYGRTVPLTIGLIGCAASLYIAPYLPTAWAVVFALGLMAFLVDMGNPVIWAFAQDVGGRQVGSALGWGNMWGNFGAALSPMIFARVAEAYGWNAVFMLGGSAFLVAALCGAMLDARRPVSQDDPS